MSPSPIEDAVAIVAGTDDDTNNPSIIMTAKDLNGALFTVSRQNQRSNDAIFDAARVNPNMQTSTIIGRSVLSLIMTPLLADFLHLARQRDKDWANLLVSRVSGVLTERSPQTWTLVIYEGKSPAVVQMLAKGVSVSIAQITSHPIERSRPLPCVPLLLKRGSNLKLLPDMETPLESGDQLLFCGMDVARREMKTTTENFNALTFVLTGLDRPDGYIWRWLSRRKTPSHA